MRWWGWAAIVSSVASVGCRIGFDEQVAPVAADSRVTRLVTLGERPTSEHVDVTADTLLDVARAAQNYGRSMYIGTYAPLPFRNTSLVRFDLGALPAAATVVAAWLELVTVDLGDTVPGSLEIRELTESWSEGLLDAEEGPGATWLERDVGVPWQIAGGTVAPALVGSLAPDPDHGPIEIALDPSVIQRWLEAPATNHGLRIESPGTQTHYHFASSEAEPPDARPQLVLEIVP